MKSFRIDVKIIIATHKPYQFPKDELYIPVHAGKHNKENIGITGDDTGDNISVKNPNFCELTALYWGWKNLQCEYLGLAHYRRHFIKSHGGSKADKMSKVLDSESINSILKEYDVILPKKKYYLVETNMEHYKNARYLKDLLKTREVIAEHYADYLPAFDVVMKRRYAHMCNMFVMRKELLNNYADWLFGILFKLEKVIDISNYSPLEARVFGFVSELLLDVWIVKNEVKYKEVPTMFLEKIQWHKKIYYFIRRRFRPKKK